MRVNKIKHRFDRIVNDLPDNDVLAYAYAFCKEIARRSGKTLAESLETIFNLDKIINMESEDKDADGTTI